MVRNCAHVAYDVTRTFAYKNQIYFLIFSLYWCLSMLHVWLMACWKWWIFTFQRNIGILLWVIIATNFLKSNYISGCQVITRFKKRKPKNHQYMCLHPMKKVRNCAHWEHLCKNYPIFIYSIRTRTRSRTSTRAWARPQELACPPAWPQKRQRTRTWIRARQRTRTLTWSQRQKRTLTLTRRILCWRGYICMDTATESVHATTRKWHVLIYGHGPQPRALNVSGTTTETDKI